MKATPADQLKLLELQQFEQKESALRHRRDSHPAHSKVRELAERAENLKRSAITQSAAISDMGREIERIEHEIELVRARRVRQQERIDNNEVPLRDINAMEHEIAQMDTRLGSLEDDQLSVEERIETAASSRQAMLDEAQAVVDDINATKQSFIEEMAVGDEELRTVIAKRRALIESLPAELVAEYERVRRLNGALAIVEVRDGVAIDIADELSPLELERIRLTAEDELYVSEDTGQIVVRTTRA